MLACSRYIGALPPVSSKHRHYFSFPISGQIDFSPFSRNSRRYAVYCKISI